MKIIGITYYDGSENVVLKSDSSMLVNRKPLFVPEWAHDLQALPCMVLRVSRLGKCIAPRYASRYYDAVAPGVDFFAADILAQVKREGRAWTEAVAFENSLAIGEWTEVESRKSKVESSWNLERNGETVEKAEWSQDGLDEVFAQTVARASAMVTIRQGDLIYVARKQAPWRLQTEDILHCINEGKETLFSKIK